MYSFQPTNEQELYELLEKIRHNDSELTSLRLDSSLRVEFSDEEAKAIAEVLQKNNNLTSIELSTLKSCEGANTIIQSIEKNTTLTSIYLEGMDACYIYCAQAIANLLENNNILTSFSVKDTRHFHIATSASTLLTMGLKSIEGANKLCDAIKKNTTLTSFELWQWGSSSYELVTRTPPVIETAINRNKKISAIASPTLKSLQRILAINGCPNEEEFNEIAKQCLNAKEVLKEIKLLHPAATQLDQIQEARIAIAAKHPWLIEPETAFELFEELNKAQKISDKNQASLEIIALNYYAEINKETGYNHLKLLRFILKNWDKNNNNEQIAHLLKQCLYRYINGQEIQMPSFAIDPVLMLETLATHKDKIPSLLQEIPYIYLVIEDIIHHAEKKDYGQSKASIALVKNTINNFNAELQPFFDLVSKITQYSEILDKQPSEIAKNKSKALMEIVNACSQPHQAPHFNSILDLIQQNRETIRQHRHSSAFSCFFPLFKSTLENRVTSYTLLKNLEKHVEKIQNSNFSQAMMQ